MQAIQDAAREETTLSPRAAVASARRARIIQAARLLFADQGFHATGIAQISRQSGVLVGQIYRDFANKEAIVAAIVEHDLDGYLDDDALNGAVERRDEGALRAWIARFLACADVDDPRLVTEIIAEAQRNERMADIFRAVDARMRAQLERALDTILPEDVAASRLAALGELILTLSAGMFQRRLRHADGPTDETIRTMVAFVDREIDWLRRGGGEDCCG